MKTTKLLTVAIVASCALGASAMADSQTSPQNLFKRPQSNHSTWDSQPKVIRTIGYPVVYLGRAGHSMLRSPEILSETFKGQRTVISKKGLFTRRDMKQPGRHVAAAPTESVGNRRG